MTGNPPEFAGLHRQLARGSAWAIGVRWGARALGVVSTIVLARVLKPADFGIVAISMILVGAVEVFNQTGQHLALIRHPDPARVHYDSAWTLLVIFGAVLAAAIFFAAPASELYFHEPRAVPVIQVLALKPLIAGFENIRVVDFQRNLEFRKQFQYRFFPSLLAFPVTIAAALLLRSYWALILGILFQEAAALALSFILSPYRPRLTLRKVKILWSFSTPAFLRNVGAYLASQIDKVVIGGFRGASTMGRYEIARDVAGSPADELNAPMQNVLFALLANARDDRLKQRSLYLTAVQWSVLICLSAGVGVSLVASDVVRVILGPKWAGIERLMPWLALAAGIQGIGSNVFPLFDALNVPGKGARLQWASLSVGAAALIFAGTYFRTVDAIAMARFVVAFFTTGAFLKFGAVALSIRLKEYWDVLWRPVLSSCVMIVAVNAALGVMDGGAIRLAVSIACGAATYLMAIFCVWYLSGAPDGPEAAVWRSVSEVKFLLFARPNA